MQTSHQYDDIIETEYPLKSHDNIRYPRMDMSERAKIFSPFAALRGHEDLIAKRAEDVANAEDLQAEAFYEFE